jgi:hypothetical protein
MEEKNFNGKQLTQFQIKNKKYGDFCNKPILTTITPIPENWISEKGGIKNGKSLLLHLTEEFGGMQNFELVLVSENDLQDDFCVNDPKNPNRVVINAQRYIKYGYNLTKLIDELEFSKQYNTINKEVSKKVPKSYLERKPSEVLFDEFNKTTFVILEKFVKNFDKLNEQQREQILKIFENSGIELEILDRFGKLEVKDPERQTKLFLKALDKMGEDKLEKILKGIIRSKKSVSLFEKIKELDREDQLKIAKNIDSLVGLASRYEAIKNSLNGFKELIDKHVKSEVKDEKEIHKFLLKNYWLLGAEYFGDPIKSSVDKSGHKISETAFWDNSLLPDFEIQRLDGNVDGIVFELEEANDPVFTKKGKLSTRVMDGINQAMKYVIFKRLSGEYSRGVAVIGSVKKPNKNQIKQLKILVSNVNVEVLTYEDIIRRAEKIIEFFEKYEAENLGNVD